MTKKRNLYAELTEGFKTLSDAGAGKRTLRSGSVKGEADAETKRAKSAENREHGPAGPRRRLTC